MIDTQKCKSKLFIIEQEFKHAEKSEYWRMKAEEEMRQRVQRKRFETLEKARKEERLAKIKEDRKIREEIVRATKSLLTASTSSPSPGGFSASSSKSSKGKKVCQFAHHYYCFRKHRTKIKTNTNSLLI